MLRKLADERNVGRHRALLVEVSELLPRAPLSAAKASASNYHAHRKGPTHEARTIWRAQRSRGARAPETCTRPRSPACTAHRAASAARLSSAGLIERSLLPPEARFHKVSTRDSIRISHALNEPGKQKEGQGRRSSCRHRKRCRAQAEGLFAATTQLAGERAGAIRLRRRTQPRRQRKRYAGSCQVLGRARRHVSRPTASGGAAPLNASHTRASQHEYTEQLVTTAKKAQKPRAPEPKSLTSSTTVRQLRISFARNTQSGGARANA